MPDLHTPSPARSMAAPGLSAAASARQAKDLAAWCARLEATLELYEGLFTEVACCAVEHDDPCVGYVTIQMARDLWLEFARRIRRK